MRTHESSDRSSPPRGDIVAYRLGAADSVITFDHSLTVHVNGEDIRALHYAKRHTDGDSIVYFPKSNVVHMGDDFVTYGLPFVDVASGGSLLGMIDNVEKAMAAVPDDVKIIPGHGALSTKADVKKFTEMLSDCVGLARYDALGQGFVKTASFTELIYNELEGDVTRTKQESRRHH